MHQAILNMPDGQLIVPSLGSSLDNIWFSLVVPTYNEEQNLALLIAQITDTLDAYFPAKYEVIIVDDNSPDGTANTALALANQYQQLRLIVRQNERGLASAVIRGWQMARGEVLGVMDGDLQHPSTVLVDLLKAIQNGADLALASRYIDGGSLGEWGFLRRLLSSGAKWLGKIILPEILGKVNDPMSGYFVLKREIIAGLLLHPHGYKILLEVLVRGRAGQIVEIPLQFALRQHGQTKVTGQLYWQYVWHLLTLRCVLWQHSLKSKN